MEKKQPNFGNFVRGELSNPDSHLSKRVRFFNTFKYLMKQNPKRYKLTFLSCFNFWDNGESVSSPVITWSTIETVREYASF